MQNVIAVIAARAGSKGIPHKNTLIINGHPLLHYTLDAIAESKRVTHTIVITNDLEFKELAEKSGLFVIDEPEDMATDDSPIGIPINYAVNLYEEQLGIKFDIVIQCEVSTPIRPSNIIDRCIDQMLKSDSDVVTTVESAMDCYPLQWMVRKETDGRIKFITNNPILNRQDSEKLFHLGGAIAIFKRKVLGVENYLQCDCSAVEYSHGECLYLDDPFDVEFAEFLLQKRSK